MKYELTVKQIEQAKTIKVHKLRDNGYMCSPTYEYKGHEIEKDDINFGGVLQWYCEDLFPNKSFDSLIELKYEIYKLENID